MELEIKKIELKDLGEFIRSYKSSEFNPLPISTKRVNSYLSNPRKNDQLPVLYLGYKDNQLVTYRSVFQDYFYSEFEKPIHSIWISGSWTHPEYRKKGLSRIIFDEVSKDYNQHIFITNYGSMSFSLYSKRSDLTNFRFIKGHRFYYRLSLSEILPPKSPVFSKSKPLLSILDTVGNMVLDTRFLFPKKNKNLPLEIAEFSEELDEFISKYNSNSLFKRNTKELQWVLDHPWVEQQEEDNDLDKKYYFTTTAKRFYQKAFVTKQENKITGFLFYAVKNEMMKVYYSFCESEFEVKTFSDFLMNEIRKEKISSLVMTDDKLIRRMKNKGGTIYSKHWNKGYFAGNKLLANFPEIKDKEIYMGDGDTIFT